MLLPSLSLNELAWCENDDTRCVPFPNVSQNSTDDDGALIKRRLYRQFLLKASGPDPLSTPVNPEPAKSMRYLATCMIATEDTAHAIKNA